MTSEEIIAQLLSGHVSIEELVKTPAKTTKAKIAKTETDSAEKKERIRTAPAKPRAIPDDETRCCARSFYEKEHLDGTILKVMRDDQNNLYGDRCKFKRANETDFCKHHGEKQPLGIWDTEYSGKFKAYVDRTESGEESAPKPKAEKPKAEKKANVVVENKPVCQIADDEDSEPVVSEGEDEIESFVVSTPAVAPKKPAPKIEEPVAEVEDYEIDGKTYLKEADGTIYDPETEDVVGKYDFAAKKWISGGPKRK